MTPTPVRRAARRSLRALAPLAAVLTLSAAAAAPASAAGTIASVGDSYASGPLIPSQIAPLSCLKSSRNTAHRVAETLAADELRDFSCSGAKTDDLYTPYVGDAGTNPAQLDAVTADTDVVMFQLGGNDIHFSDIVDECTNLNPFASTCKSHFTAGGVDRVSADIVATAPKIDAGLQAIRARGPQAKIFVLGYPQIVPASGSGCWPQVPFLSADTTWFRAKTVELNAMLAQRAAANGAVYVDLYTPSSGHDACRNSETRWVEALVPGNTAAPFHPNMTGMQGFAAAAVATMRAHGV